MEDKLRLLQNNFPLKKTNDFFIKTILFMLLYMYLKLKRACHKKFVFFYIFMFEIVMNLSYLFYFILTLIYYERLLIFEIYS